MRSSTLTALLVLCAMTGSYAQLADIDPDWKETEVPPPPAFKTDQLIPLEMPRHLTTRFGVDPDSLRITPDGIVRYVMVASSPSGNLNVSYEGIRCLTAEVKVYARRGATGQWNAVSNAQWRPLNGNQPSLHALALARQGACAGRAATAQSNAEIVRRLKNPNSEASQH